MDNGRKIDTRVDEKKLCGENFRQIVDPSQALTAFLR